MQMPRMRFTVRRLMAVVAVFAVIMSVLVPLLKAIDAASRLVIPARLGVGPCNRPT